MEVDDTETSPVAGSDRGTIRFEIGPMVAEPNKIAVQVEGFAKTVEGAAYNNLYHVYFELAGGKIVRAREYNDTAHVLDTLRARGSADEHDERGPRDVTCDKDRAPSGVG